jgi:hypothetical protein
VATRALPIREVTALYLRGLIRQCGRLNISQPYRSPQVIRLIGVMFFFNP